MSETLLLEGLDAGNPLGFLAALGVLALSQAIAAEPRLAWRQAQGGWRPQLSGCGSDDEALAAQLFEALRNTSSTPFTIDKKLPFSHAVYREALHRAAECAEPGSRRNADLLAAFGSDAHQDDKGYFVDTALRMVRSGDAAGQGLPAYAEAIRNNTDSNDLYRVLFHTWDYQDDDFSLRWDPAEDQRYALRWHDPSQQSNKKYGLRTMRGANALALEGLALLPVQPKTNGIATTGFKKLDRGGEAFTWPIWSFPATIDLVRSLLTLEEIHQSQPNRCNLHRRGIVEIYRSERIFQNQYYKNFSPAGPV